MVLLAVIAWNLMHANMGLATNYVKMAMPLAPRGAVVVIVVVLGMPGRFVKYRCRARLVRGINLAAIKETLPVLRVTVHAIARLGTKAFYARRQ